MCIIIISHTLDVLKSATKHQKNIDKLKKTLTLHILRQNDLPEQGGFMKCLNLLKMNSMKLLKLSTKRDAIVLQLVSNNYKLKLIKTTHFHTPYFYINSMYVSI
jgi:hypothetical protein